MKFSIVIVSYNAGEKLKYTVESCLDQDYQDYELIIKDACSNDKSTDFLKSITDDRVRLICRADSGIYEGMNQAIEVATGELTIFMNCGDTFYDREVLSKVISYVESTHTNIIYYGDCYVVSRGGIVQLPAIWDNYCCYRYTICHQAMLYTTNYLKHNPFDTRNTISACITHYIDAFARHDVQFVHLPFIICRYEGHGVSDTPEGRRKSLDAQYEMLKECFGAKHGYYMCKMALSGQLLKQRISTTPWLFGFYETIASAVYSRRNSK